MIASVMLLATTNQVCQDVAVIPFLWVAPLSLYLLSFILCFDSGRWYSRIWYGLGGMLAVGLVVLQMTNMYAINISAQIFVYFTALFAICMLCHGELARLKPEPKRLTSFYLTMAAGGASGGIFVGGIAPLVFPLFFEMDLILLVCSILAYVVYLDAKAGQAAKHWAALWGRMGSKLVVLGTVFLLTLRVVGVMKDSVEIERNFYGVLRVLDQVDEGTDEKIKTLVHGSIVHGLQFQSSDNAMIQTSYYGVNSGIGLAIDA